MPFPEAVAPVVFSAQELLAFDSDDLVRFLNDCRTPNNDFDISRVQGLDGLTKGQQAELGEKLSVAAEKAGPINSDELSRLLGVLVSHAGNGDTPLPLHDRQVRSPTSSPSPEDNSSFEAYCHNELEKAGGRPVLSFEQLLEALKGDTASREILRPWLDDKASVSRDGDVPPVFSTQLEDWESFQHKWQWDNRGKYAGDEGFAAFLESRRKRFIHKGESEMVSDPSFEDTARSIWQYEERFLELSGKDGFVAYTQAVDRRLTSHNFTQPFQLAENPRYQDTRTTLIEYLNYVYWLQDKYTVAMEAAEPQYRKAWDKLEHFDTSSLLTLSTTGALDEELSAARVELETVRRQIREFKKDTQIYRRREAVVRRQKLRARWVLEQLSLIDTASSKETSATENSSSANRGKKRKAREDHDIIPRQQPKRRRQHNGPGGSTLGPGLGIEKGSDISKPDETVAAPTTAGSQPRRSQRLSAGAGVAQLQSGQGGIQKTRPGRSKEKSLGSKASGASRARKRKVKSEITQDR